MAFCNSCGATLSAGAKFCNKCGATIAGVPSATTPASVPATGSSSAVKIILIIAAVIVVLGIAAVTGIGIIGYHVTKNARVHQDGNNVKVDTPFGTVESTQDTSKAVSNLGVDVYPGADVQTQGTSSVTIGSMHTVTASFESSDSPDKVCDFYKPKFPNAVVTTTQHNHCTIVSNDKQNMVTINVEPSGDGSKFQISSVTKK
jgi:hypothetical protein